MASNQGFKRNLCCHLATGLIIAHFDDDDLCAKYFKRFFLILRNGHSVTREWDGI